MDDFQRSDSFDPADYLRVLRRRWWIVLLLIIITTAGAVGYVLVAPKQYTSTASVYVTSTGANANQVSGGRTTGSVNMDTEAQVVQSIAVATIAAKALHTTASPAELSAAITVTVPANSQVMQIACAEHTAQMSAACAEAFAKAYLSNRSATATSQINGQLKTLRSQVTTLQRAVTGLQGKIANLPPNSPARASDQTQLTSDQGQLSGLSHQLATVTAEQANNSGGYIITNAATPTTPSSPQTKLILPSGVALGLIIGLIIAFVVDTRDKRIRLPKDIERHLDLPVLLNVSVKTRNPQPMLVNPRSRPGQAFAELAQAIMATLGEGSHVLMVVGTSAGTGGSFTAANLALSLARMRSDVVLVSADGRGTIIPELFGLSRGRGLSDVLTGSASLFEVAQRPAESGRLRVVTPGTDPAIDLYSLQLDVPKQLIGDLRADSTMVIIEAQAAGASGETLMLAELADAAVVVAEAGQTTRQEVGSALERLDRLRTSVLGGVLIPHFGEVVRPRRPVQAPPADSLADRPRPREHGALGDHSQVPALPQTESGETRPLPLATVRGTDQPGRMRPRGSDRAEMPRTAGGSDLAR